MQNTQPIHSTGGRMFKRQMTCWGLALVVVEASALIALGQIVPIPDRISFLTLLVGWLVFVAVGGFVFFPLWWLSNHLRRRFGLLCPNCGRWLSIRSEREAKCTHCERNVASLR